MVLSQLVKYQAFGCKLFRTLLLISIIDMQYKNMTASGIFDAAFKENTRACIAQLFLQ